MIRWYSSVDISHSMITKYLKCKQLLTVLTESTTRILRRDLILYVMREIIVLVCRTCVQVGRCFVQSVPTHPGS
jgi:hypothetical protein